jgi:Na+/proline symporter
MLVIISHIQSNSTQAESQPVTFFQVAICFAVVFCAFIMLSAMFSDNKKESVNKEIDSLIDKIGKN